MKYIYQRDTAEAMRTSLVRIFRVEDGTRTFIMSVYEEHKAAEICGRLNKR